MAHKIITPLKNVTVKENIGYCMSRMEYFLQHVRYKINGLR